MPATGTGMTETYRQSRNRNEVSSKSASDYAGTLSGNTASILFFSVAALNGLTM
jgi:hypothetical protein